MKKALTVIAIAISLMSCSVEDTCGNATGFAQEMGEHGTEFFIQLDGGDYFEVTPQLFENTHQGEYICIW
tara:strand:- start:139 stop:348 length:210 start_codon:yes stop_codon:yes gene_type:complete